MSTWGVDAFENDAVQDLVDQVLDGTVRLAERCGTFRSEERDGCIEADAGAELIALGTIVRVARDPAAPAADALAEIAGTDELDLSGFLGQFSDDDLQTLHELSGAPDSRTRTGVSARSA